MFLFAWTLFGNLVFVPLAAANSPFLGLSIVATILGGMTILTLHDLRQGRSYHRLSPSLSPIPSPYSEQVSVWMKDAAVKLSYSGTMPDVHLNLADGSACPSVQDGWRASMIIVPVGFLKVMDVAPDSARALIAHEMSHVAHHDGRSLLVTTSVMRSAIKFLLPVRIVGLSLVGVGILASPSIVDEVSRQYDAKIEAARIRDIKRLEAAAHSGVFVSSLESRDVEAEKLSVVGDLEKSESALKTDFVQSPLSLALMMLVIFSLKNLRQLCEERCDLAAAVTVGKEAALQSIKDYIRDPKWQFLSLHPKQADRIKSLKKAAIPSSQ